MEECYGMVEECRGVVLSKHNNPRKKLTQNLSKRQSQR